MVNSVGIYRFLIFGCYFVVAFNVCSFRFWLLFWWFGWVIGGCSCFSLGCVLVCVVLVAAMLVV